MNHLDEYDTYKAWSQETYTASLADAVASEMTTAAAQMANNGIFRRW